MQTNDTINTGTDNQLDDDRTIEGAIKVVAEPDNALVVLDPPRFASELFKPFNDDLAAAKRKRTKYDITTKEGMDVAKGVLASLVKIRTGAEKAKTKAKRPIDLAGKEILSQYNALEAACKAEEKKHADAITEENARIARIEEEKRQLERARIEAIEGRIEDLRLIPSTLAKADSATIEGKLNELLARVLAPADYQEHLELAIGAQNLAINELRQLLTETREAENQAAELARLRADDAKRKEAAEAMQHQQEQMQAIMELQGLATTLTATGQAGERAAVEAALAKARAFDPAAYGAMAPMAELARDAAMKQLEQLRANLPAPVIVTDLAAPGADSTVTVDIEADDTGVVIGKAVVSTEALEQLAKPVQLAQAYFGGGGGRVIPKATRPADLAMAELVALQYDVSNETAIGWLATFDADGARAALAGS